MGWVTLLLRVLAAWLERLNLTQGKRDQREAGKKKEDAHREADKMDGAIARGPDGLSDVERRLRDLQRR